MILNEPESRLLSKSSSHLSLYCSIQDSITVIVYFGAPARNKDDDNFLSYV